MNGASLHGLETELRANGVIGSRGTPIERTGIRGILTSETYLGDLRLQKTFSSGIHKVEKNRGQQPQYYVQGAHEALVTREEFDAVQELFSEKAVKQIILYDDNIDFIQEDGKVKSHHRSIYDGGRRQYCYTKKVKCGCCGDKFSKEARLWTCQGRR